MSFMTQDVRVNKGSFFENSVNGQSRLVHVIVNGRSGYETQQNSLLYVYKRVGYVTHA